MIELLLAWAILGLSVLVSAGIVVAVVAADKRTKRHSTEWALSRRADYHHWLLMNGYTDEKGFLR